MLIILSGMFTLTLGQGRSPWDNGVIWAGDYFINFRGQNRPILDYPYIYVLDHYGIRLHKIIPDVDSIRIEMVDVIPGETEDGSIRVFGNLVIWGDNRLFIAQRRNDELTKIFEAVFPEFGLNSGLIIDITTDSLLIHRKAIFDISIPAEPEILNDSINITTNCVVYQDKIYWLYGPLRTMDISDPENPSFIDSLAVEYGINHGVSPKRIGNALAFQHIYGALFVFLDDDLNIADTLQWSSPNWVNGLQVIQDSLFLALRMSSIHGPYNGMVCEIFDPSRYPDNTHLATFELPESERLTIYDKGDFCTTEDSLLYYYGQLWNLADFDNPELIYETNALLPDSLRLMAASHLGFSDGKVLVTTNNATDDIWVSDLLSDIFPDTIVYIDNLDIRSQEFAEILDSVLVDRTGVGTIVFGINEDRSAEQLYIINGDFSRIKLERIEDNYYLAATHSSGMQLYRLDSNRAVRVDSIETSANPGGMEFTDQGLFLACNGILWWYEVVDDDIAVIDTVHHINRSGGKLCANRDWVAFGQNLWSVEDGEMIYEHSFEPPNNGEYYHKAIALYRNRIALRGVNSNGSVTTIIDLSDGEFNDTLAMFLDGWDNAYMHGDFIWSWSNHALMKFYITGDYVHPVSEITPITLAEDFYLASPYPNPFNPSVTVPFFIPSPSDVTINVYNITGQLVTTIFNGRISAGQHNVSWSGNNLSGARVSSGIYFVRLTTPAFAKTKKITILK